MNEPARLSKFFTDIASTYWWVSVVIVGLLINLASAYIKPYLDNLYASTSTRWREVLARRNTEYNKMIEELINDHVLLTITGIEELRARIRSLVFLILSLIVISLMQALESFMGYALISSPHTLFQYMLGYSLGFAFLVVGFSSFTSAIRIGRLLTDVKVRKSK